MRWPRTLTWKSSRPWCSSRPSWRQRPRSPVRYRRACGSALEGIGHEALGGQFGPVPGSPSVTPSPPMKISPETPTGQRLALRIEHVDAGVGDRPADRDGLRLRRHLPAGGPDRGLGRAVQVPEFAGCAAESCSARLRAQALAADQGLEGRRAVPAGVDQHAPGRRRGLHHRGPASARAASRSASPSTACSRVASTTVAPIEQRQQQLEHRDVEAQRGDGHAARPARVSPGSRCIDSRKFTTARCGTTTPLGLPVEPEV